MFNVTPVASKPFSVDEADVLRIQHAITGIMQPGSNARIDAKVTLDVVDDPKTIADKVNAAVKPPLGVLTLPNGNPVWFSGPATQGPIWIPQGEIDAKTKSAVLIAGKRLFVRNSPEDVARIVKEAGGYVLPIKTLWNDLDAAMKSVVPEPDTVQDWPDQDR
ncbi:UNVERIFIED_ORG: hypothetical protein J2W19_004677 [Shinella zoogloeoides]|nr:hypothetical protein [Shinella zoogloeoides]